MSTTVSTPTGTGYKRVIKVNDLPRLSKTKNLLRTAMINIILDNLMPKTGRTAWKTENALLIKRLTSTPDLKHLERVLDLTLIADDNEKYSKQNREYIIKEASSALRYDLNVVHANREFLHHYDNDMSHFAFIITRIPVTLGYKSTERIPTLEAHLLAYRNYGLVGNNGIALFGCYDYSHTQLCRIIEKNPTQAKLILDYRDLMGNTDITETGFKTFAAKHTTFTPEQEQAIWKTRSTRIYNNVTMIPRAIYSNIISQEEWETTQDREAIMALR